MGGEKFVKVDGEDGVGYWVRFGDYSGVTHFFRRDAENDQEKIGSAVQSRVAEAVKAQKEKDAKIAIKSSGGWNAVGEMVAAAIRRQK